VATGTVKLIGGEELRRKLLTIDKKVAKQISSQALRAGAKVMLDATRRITPVISGTLKRSLKVRAGKRKKDRVSFQVQTRDGDYKGETFYGAFVNFGHRVGKRKARRNSRTFNDTRKEVPANPFMARGFELSKNAALSKVTDVLKSGIEAAV
jgi:HK97 gp10 family phage protein